MIFCGAFVVVNWLSRWLGRMWKHCRFHNHFKFWAHWNILLTTSERNISVISVHWYAWEVNSKSRRKLVEVIVRNYNVQICFLMMWSTCLCGRLVCVCRQRITSAVGADFLTIIFFTYLCMRTIRIGKLCLWPKYKDWESAFYGDMEH